MNKSISVLILVSILVMLSFSIFVYASPDAKTYTSVTISSTSLANTVPVAAVEISSAYPTINIGKISLFNSDIAIEQTITLYDTCTTTANATAIWTVKFTSATTVSQMYETDFPTDKPLQAHYGVYIRKSNDLSVVGTNILYW